MAKPDQNWLQDDGDPDLAGGLGLLRAIVGTARDAIIVSEVGADGEPFIAFANPAFTEQTGYTVEEVVGRHPRILVGPDTDYDTQLRIRQSVERREPITAELVHYRKDGSTFWVENSITPIPDANGEFAQLVSIQRDITARKRAEDALRRSENRFRSLVQHGTDLIFVTDGTGRLQYTSPSVTTILGYDRAALTGFGGVLVHRDDRPFVNAEFDVVAGLPGAQRRFEFRALHRTGGIRWLEATLTNLLDDPSVQGVVANARDITERKLAEVTLRESEERSRALVQHTSDVISVLNPDGTFRYSSPSVERIFGHVPGSREGESALDLVHPDDLERVAAMFTTVLSNPGVSEPIEFRLNHADGGWRWVEAVANNLVDHPAVEGVIVTLRDVTQRRGADDELRARAAQQAVVVSLGQAALSGAPLDQLFQQSVDAVCDTLGVPLGAVLELAPEGDALRARGGSGWSIPGGQGLKLPAGQGSQAGLTLDRGEPIVSENYTSDPRFEPAPLLRARGVVAALTVPIGGDDRRFGVLGVWTTAARRFNPDDVNFVQAVANVLGSAIDRWRSEEELRHQALHDALTALPNRTFLHEELADAVRNVERRGKPAALLLMDLDRFKEINDTLGHNVGDVVLRQVGERLASVVRGSDVVARLGGDEFAVLLTGIAAPEDAGQVARKILEALELPFEVDGNVLRVGASIGISIAPRDGRDGTSLLQCADVAMYHAKELDEGFALYAPEHDENRLERLSLFSELHQAIDADQLTLAYQPKIDLATGSVVGVEALVRWDHPTRGRISPDQFIPLAEHTGLIKPLSGWVLRTALQQAQAWHGEGIRLPVAVNLSARNLHDPELVSIVAGELRSAGLEPEWLELEITESAVMQNPDDAMQTVTRLASMGIDISIDDFGTGYSSLAYLQRLPVRELKIDRSFITALDTSGRDRAIVASVIELAHNLGLRTVAEGVETAEMADALAALGCETAQGYYFAKPMSAGELTDWLPQGHHQTSLQPAGPNHRRSSS